MPDRFRLRELRGSPTPGVPPGFWQRLSPAGRWLLPGAASLALWWALPLLVDLLRPVLLLAGVAGVGIGLLLMFASTRARP